MDAAAHPASRSLQPGQSYALSVADYLCIFNPKCPISRIYICCLQPRTWTSNASTHPVSNSATTGPTWTPVLTRLKVKSNLWSLGAALLASQDGTAKRQTTADLGRAEQSPHDSRKATEGPGGRILLQVFSRATTRTKLENKRIAQMGSNLVDCGQHLSRPMPRA